MSTKWKIILACLGLQALIIFGITGIYADEFRGQYGSLSYILIYFPAVLVSVLLSIIVFYKERFNNPGLITAGILTSLCVWIVIP